MPFWLHSRPGDGLGPEGKWWPAWTYVLFQVLTLFISLFSADIRAWSFKCYVSHRQWRYCMSPLMSIHKYAPVFYTSHFNNSDTAGKLHLRSPEVLYGWRSGNAYSEYIHVYPKWIKSEVYTFCLIQFCESVQISLKTTEPVHIFACLMANIAVGLKNNHRNQASP